MSHQQELPKTDRAASKRILELDALRGLAAIAVVMFHYTTRYDQLFLHSEPLKVSLPLGGFGVNLFFMLSGFVILMTLERTADSLKFAWGRFSRLYPAYWAAALLTFVVISCCGLPGHEVSFSEALVNLTMVQALLGTPHIDGVYWSLQAELIFYANMLLLYRLGAFRRPALTVIAWVTVAMGVQLAQGYAEITGPTGAALLSKFATIASLKFIPLFGIGVLLYDRQRSGGCSFMSKLAMSACVLSCGFEGGFTALVINALLAILLWLATSSRVSFLACRPLIALGAISYTLYLVHQNIGYMLIRNLESRGVGPLLAIAIAGAVSICLATCLHRWVERPSMQLLRKIDVVSLARRARLVSANS